MNLANVKLILFRELRDQMRDRRTLFMIFVLPILLYPLMGITILRVAQFLRGEPAKVLIIGRQGLPEKPPLVGGDHFAAELFDEPEQAELLKLQFSPEAGDAPGDDQLMADAAQALKQGELEAVVQFPADFAQRLAEYRAALFAARAPPDSGATEQPAPSLPTPTISFNAAKEKSQLAEIRVRQVLANWRDKIGRDNLTSGGFDASAARPFDLASSDVADKQQRDAVLWSKILPFVLLLWALTGAFYPAVDLCAGEKERGTLETLLTSPAARSEIVWGKLLTVMIFSVVTALLNLASISVTGSFVMSQIENISRPSPWALLWVILVLVPVSALFSALCLALAALARSTKEGQYYLMPLAVVIFPLVTITMWPTVELTLGTSIIPITGAVLLLRALLESDYALAARFAAPVIVVTVGCCLAAIRWAVDQFNRESVLFRESERLEIGLWLRHLFFDRQPTPSVPEAIACGILILTVQFFLSLAMGQSIANTSLTQAVLIVQLAAIATPALLMTIVLTRSPVQTLQLRAGRLMALPVAVLLAVCLHPVAVVISHLINELYPVSEVAQQQFSNMFDEVGVWQLLLLVAVVPAICEELAFRGFILSGLRHLGRKWQAIVLSAIFFGLAHQLLQQSIGACLIGLVIGYLAVQTGSVWPCILYHMTHNGLLILAGTVKPEQISQSPLLRLLMEESADTMYGNSYRWQAVALGCLAAAALLIWLRSLPHDRTTEESLQETIEHEAVHPKPT